MKLSGFDPDQGKAFGDVGSGLSYIFSSLECNMLQSCPQPSTSVLDLEPCFFDTLVPGADEHHFVNGLREIVRANKETALVFFLNAALAADGALMAGWLCLERQDFFRAKRYLGYAVTHERDIGRLFGKYGIVPVMDLSIADDIFVRMTATPSAARMTLAEIFRRQQQLDEASNILKNLCQTHPDDPVIRLCAIELLANKQPDDPVICEQILKLSDGLTGNSAANAGILLHRTHALRMLSLHSVVIDTISGYLNYASNIPDDLMYALRYEYALALEDSGEKDKYRLEIERLYAAAPDYADVAERISGMK